MMKSIFKNNRGTAAIEFALVAPMFFIVAFAVSELGWVLTQSIAFDMALNRAGRSLQLEGNTISLSQIRNAICDNTMLLHDCENSVIVEYSIINSAADIENMSDTCLLGSSSSNPEKTYTDVSTKIIVISACYLYDPIFPELGTITPIPKTSEGLVKIKSAYSAVTEASE